MIHSTFHWPRLVMQPCLTSKRNEAVPSNCVPRGRTGIFENIPKDHHTSPLYPKLFLQILIIPRLTLEAPVQFLSQILRTFYFWAPAASHTLSKVFSCILPHDWSHKVTPLKSVHAWTARSTMKSHSISVTSYWWKDFSNSFRFTSMEMWSRNV